ncbi:DNA-directed RNA polymerase subunit alpha [Candidatus Saccharibacteria bacterium]|nr:DNA-directed RNA polymerase subunit alpha [Candidatus Saccharibacteria bacterium]
MALYDINLPEMKEEQIDERSSRFVIAPLYPGYGMTIGNSLRRVLLSSLAGAAVTAVRINGVDHEFTTIKGMREDVIALIMNIKQLKVRHYGDEPVVLTLAKSGKGSVTGADIKASGDTEVVSKDLELCYLDDAKAKLEIEFKVEQGRGYSPVENRGTEKLPVGWIAVDAIYTPIKRVRFSIENTRVGQMTNLDSLQMEVETDGSVTPLEAVKQAAEILVGHFQVVAGLDVVSVGTDGIMTAEAKAEAEHGAVAIEELSLSQRTTNALINNDITTVGDLTQLAKAELKGLKGFGQKAFEEVIEKLEEIGIKLA